MFNRVVRLSPRITSRRSTGLCSPELMYSRSRDKPTRGLFGQSSAAFSPNQPGIRGIWKERVRLLNSVELVAKESTDIVLRKVERTDRLIALRWHDFGRSKHSPESWNWDDVLEQTVNTSRTSHRYRPQRTTNHTFYLPRSVVDSPELLRWISPWACCWISPTCFALGVRRRRWFKVKSTPAQTAVIDLPW